MSTEKTQYTWFCKGCRNQCRLEVTLEDKKVIKTEGGGCRRAMLNAKKYLEHR